MKLIYIRLQQFKYSIWAHYLMILGWINIFLSSCCIFLIKDGYILILPIIMVVLYYSLIPFIILFLIELLIFPDFKIDLNFIKYNKLYNILWIVGFLTGISLYLVSILFIISIL